MVITIILKIFTLNNLSLFLQTKGYADAVNSGTSALFAILNSLNIDKKELQLFLLERNPGSVTPLALLDF